WKQFDFNANFTFFVDFDVYNATNYYLSSSIGNNIKNQQCKNVLAEYANRWTYVYGAEYTYKNTNYPEYEALYLFMNEGQTRWNPAGVNKDVTMSYFVEDGSFLRCNDISIGYSLPANVIRHAGMSKCRFYASVANPFIITNYSGFDPEVDVQSGLTPSYDYNRYPRSRSYVLGVNLSF
ncbi:MAG: SusC/RagA family protein, partial [Duncaniella sp.]|nr:SusC/RagA family protein [Duncaniella sp.]